MTTHSSRLDATTRTWMKPDTPRSFLLHFNQRKLKSANPARRIEYQQYDDLWGVLFPNGAVSLERPYINKNYFFTLTEMCDSFSALGDYDIQWLDEMEA